MQFSTLFLAALSATGSLAAPLQSRGASNEVRVALSNQAIELGVQNTFVDGKRDVKTPSSSGPFQTVELRLGPKVKNPNLRCQIRDQQNKPITVVRGANVDITFADGGKGPWTLKKTAKVSSIICDPAFKQGSARAAAVPRAESEVEVEEEVEQYLEEADIDDEEEVPTLVARAKDTKVRVLLQNTAAELGATTTFDNVKGRASKRPTASKGPFTSVTLSVGAGAKQDLRCQILDNNRRPIKVKRGANVDTTFADGGKGAWTFLEPKKSQVSEIICDPAFKKAA
ncbi:hypothetical protein BU24DRAFT_427034 [Aaosphaeria arxii CBS 175.79]|uniref:Uncharacterized protein n=1 Tax=Aaosphaeria arxii CBS 175.79 TaxID=1450172 RepID=A0A6A5XDJ0_9PLEO|nr:uncharacterized protein BU24DRAFT_427034 [Aaosphaeria arxii CBS 175.79]KAF2010834.1 hypothetical protein BU24DRAFT_427034 [Aaosphaeria arxii CBS 175.79]